MKEGGCFLWIAGINVIATMLMGIPSPSVVGILLG